MAPCPIVAALRTGQQPWHTHHGPRPVTATDRPYSGAASVALWLAKRPCPVWMTAAKASQLSGHVRPGEAPSLIPHGDGVAEVYNAAQIDGLRRFPPARPFDPARFIAASGARLTLSERPCYNTAFDFIGTTGMGAWGEIAHGLIRWTAWRVGRDLPLATEMMVAEIGAALLCADWGLKPVPRYDQAALIGCWLDRLAKKPGMWIDAANAAGRAVEYLHGLQPKPAVDLAAEWKLAA